LRVDIWISTYDGRETYSASQELVELAGNAFNGAVVAAVLLAMAVCFPFGTMLTTELDPFMGVEGEDGESSDL
jgi:hypothetical protein